MYVGGLFSGVDFLFVCLGFFVVLEFYFYVQNCWVGGFFEVSCVDHLTAFMLL